MSVAIEAKNYPSIGTALDARIDKLSEQEAAHLNAIENVDERLQAAGFQTVTVADFLGLSPEEEELIEVRLSLARALRERRKSVRMTQADLAKKIGSSQSRVAKVEMADPSVSLDLLVRAFFATGATHLDMGRALSFAAPVAGSTKG